MFFFIHYRQTCRQVSLCLIYGETLFHLLALFHSNDFFRQENVSGNELCPHFFQMSLPLCCIFMP